MKLLLVFALVAWVSARPGDDNHYDTKYDNFNVDEVVQNQRLMKAYAHCFIGDGKCTPEGNDVKKWIPDGSTNACAKCTSKQKTLVAKFIKGLQEKCPEEWEILSTKADPEGKHQEELKKFLEEHAH